MRKIAILVVVLVACAFSARAQKFALIDMEYILGNIPSYEMVNNQIDQLSQKYQKEVEAATNEAQEMYKKFVADKVYLTPEQAKAREEEIVAKEKAATELRYKYFGPDGEINTYRQKLLLPIQDEVYNAIKAVSEERGYQAIFDRASSSDIIYASPKIDVSDEVLLKLGYSK